MSRTKKGALKAWKAACRDMAFKGLMNTAAGAWTPITDTGMGPGIKAGYRLLNPRKGAKRG